MPDGRPPRRTERGRRARALAGLRIRRWGPSTLRWRLTAWVAAVLLVSAAVIFVVVYANTGSQLQRQIDRDLAGDVSQFSQALTVGSGRTAPQIVRAAQRYVNTQPFRSTSTLLFAVVGGVGIATNHPELFRTGQPDHGETMAEQAREDAYSRRLLATPAGYAVRILPDVGRVRVLVRSSVLADVNVSVGAGEPLVIVARAQRSVARAFLLAGGLTIALALMASYLAGARVSAPLRRLAAVATRIDAGDLAPRMAATPGRSGEEVQVLAEAFNHMLDRLAEAFSAQRQFVADASHELRTPLTVIQGQLEVLAAQPDPSEADVRRVQRLVTAEITRMSRLVDDLLLLAAAEQTNFLRVEQIDLPAFVSDLWDGISLTAHRRFELGPVPEGRLQADPDRLAQAIRNLARNAVEHTEIDRGLVRLEVTRVEPDGVRFAISDDGPGIPVSERQRVFERFHRTDAGRSREHGGAGLGLAIVRAIADAHGGTVTARDPDGGSGARVELELPGFAPSRSPALARVR